MQQLSENELSNIILGCAIEVHRQLGPGLLESAYRECLYYELTKAGLDVQKEPSALYELGEAKNQCQLFIKM